MTAPNRSVLRQRLRRLHERLGRILDSLDTRQPTFAGVVYRMKTRCGKRPCVCLQGDLHAAWCLSYKEGKKRRLRTIPPEKLDQLRTLAQRYRRLRQGRAQMNRTYEKMIETLDRLERSLRVPPGQALAPPNRRRS